MAQSQYNPHANGMLAFVLSHHNRYKEDVRLIAPGHPVYERIRAEVLAEIEEDAANG